VSNRSKADNLSIASSARASKVGGDFETERYGGLEIDGEPVLRGSLHS
jgi:hypothetical protein